MTETAPIRIDGGNTTLLLEGTDGVPRIAYWGSGLRQAADAAGDLRAGKRPVPRAGLDANPPLTVVPETGTGFPGHPGLAGHRNGEDWMTCFGLAEIRRRGPGEATLVLRDATAGLRLEIACALDDTDVLTVDTTLVNEGEGVFQVDWLAAACFPVDAALNERLSLHGRWCQEFLVAREPIGAGAWLQENRRGRTSHDRFPGVFIGEAGFGEQHGRVQAFHLGWSGNHRLLIERLADGSGQLQLGELLLPGECPLAPGAVVSTPTVYATWSDSGMARASQRLHARVRRLMDWPRPGTERPVLLNTREAVCFDHDPARLRALADAARAVGAERFVLDDGWFRGRDSERAGLGDWFVDENKYPDGLTPLIEYVNALGMDFGLWVEPEMVNPDSDLYRANPDWVLSMPGRRQPLGRYQYVLDLTRAPVRAYLLERLDDLLSRHDIACLKWDMNRDLTQPGSMGRAAVRAQVLAVYELIDALRERHPGIEIESCASGGGRADYGVLRRTHRIWTSDCNDPLERQRIQRGFSLFFPPEIMGAHFGAESSRTTGRRHGVAFRAITALFGHMGIEQDVTRMTEGERTELAGWVDLHKRFRPLLHSGLTVRLDYPDPAAHGYGVVARDGSEALFAYVQMAMAAGAVPAPLRLADLDPHGRYRVRLLNPPPRAPRLMKHMPRTLTGAGAVIGGDWLMRHGVQPPVCAPESACLFHCTREDADPRRLLAGEAEDAEDPMEPV